MNKATKIGIGIAAVTVGIVGFSTVLDQKAEAIRAANSMSVEDYRAEFTASQQANWDGYTAEQKNQFCSNITDPFYRSDLRNRLSALAESKYSIEMSAMQVTAYQAAAMTIDLITVNCAKSV